MIVLYGLTSCVLDTLKLLDLPLDIVSPEVPNTIFSQLMRVRHMHLERLDQAVLGQPLRFDLVRVIVS